MKIKNEKSCRLNFILKFKNIFNMLSSVFVPYFVIFIYLSYVSANLIAAGERYLKEIGIHHI